MLAQLLLENGANVNMKSNDGTTPLSVAIAKFKDGDINNICCNVSIIKLLIQNGGIINVDVMDWVVEALNAFDVLEKFMKCKTCDL